MTREEMCAVFAAGLNNFQKRIRWNQSVIARELNVTSQNVWKWGAGKGLPSYEILMGLFKLGMTPEEAFGDVVKSSFKESTCSTDLINESAEKTPSDPNKASKIILQGLIRILDDLNKSV